MKKRFTSLLVAASMFISMIASTSCESRNPVQSDDTKTEDLRDETQYGIASSNSVGNYLAEHLNNKQVFDDTSADPVKSNDGEFDIIDLNFDTDTGMITARTTQSSACRLTVKFLTDDRSEVVNTIDKQLVPGCDTTTSFAVDTENLPEYYLILAELYDSHNNMLCNTQYCETYTKNMQEILHTDIYDFDQDRVLNFDDDPTSNFIALSEDAIIAESSETKNVLLSADYEFGEFVFENADETLINLKKDDLLYIQPTPENMIAIAVDSVEVRDDIVTIKQSDEPIDDIFDFIKIEEETTLDGAYVDTSTMDEGVTYQGLNSDFPELNLDQDRKILDSGDQEGKLSTKLSFSIDDLKLSDKAKIGGSADLTIALKINFYKKKDYTSFKTTVETALSLSATATVEAKTDPLTTSAAPDQSTTTNATTTTTGKQLFETNTTAPILTEETFTQPEKKLSVGKVSFPVFTLFAVDLEPSIK